mgnify:FL=1
MTVSTASINYRIRINDQWRLCFVGVPPRRINEIVKGLRGITADTALRLGRHFGTSA